MNGIKSAILLSSALIGCAGSRNPQTVFYDLETINRVPGGISAALVRPMHVTENRIVAPLGTCEGSSIEIAVRAILDTPLVIGWRTKDPQDHIIPFPFHILPPLDTANQKYHLRFTFYPGDSVKIQARAVAKSSCRHILDHGATAFAAFGPCISDDGYSKTLDSIRAGLVHHPWKGPMDIPGWD